MAGHHEVGEIRKCWVRLQAGCLASPMNELRLEDAVPLS